MTLFGSEEVKFIFLFPQPANEYVYAGRGRGRMSQQAFVNPRIDPTLFLFFPPILFSYFCRKTGSAAALLCTIDAQNPMGESEPSIFRSRPGLGAENLKG